MVDSLKVLDPDGRLEKQSCPLPPDRVVDVAYPSSCPSGTCRRSPFFWRRANAVDWHPTRTIICAAYARSRVRLSVFTRVQGGANETCPPKAISAFRGWGSRADCNLAHRMGASLSDPASALDRWIRRRWR